MKVLDYKIDNKNLIVYYENDTKVISNYTDKDLMLVLLGMLEVARELNDLEKERECLISLLNLKIKLCSLDELRCRSLDEGLIPSTFLINDSEYLKISLSMQTPNYKKRVKNKKFFDQLNSYGVIYCNDEFE